MATLLDTDLIAETLRALPGWSGDATKIWRDVHLTPELDAELRRQISVDGTAMQHQPLVETIAGGSRFTLTTGESGGVTELDIMLASHISDLAHRLADGEPGIDATRRDDPTVIFRNAEGAGGDTFEQPTELRMGDDSIQTEGVRSTAPEGPFTPREHEL